MPTPIPISALPERLEGFAGALGAVIFQDDTVLLKNSSLHAKRRHLIGPGIDLADRDFNRVLCAGRCGQTRRNGYGKNRE